MTPLLLGAAVQLPPSVILAKPSSSKNFESYYSTYRVEAELLEDRNHIQDLNLPNLTSAGGTNRPRYFQLRGIGERSAYEGMPNSSVSVIIDNIDYTGVGGVLSLQGSQSLEVYKGPQNTLIGPSALAGMIISSTKSPKNKSSSFHIERSSFNTTDIGLQQSLSYSDINAFLSVNYLKSDGYFTNTYLNREDTNHRDELSIKSRIDFNDFSRNGDRILDAKSAGYPLENGIQNKMLQCCYENRAQDVPEMLQDTPIRPKMPQELPQIPPIRSQKTPRCA